MTDPIREDDPVPDPIKPLDPMPTAAKPKGVPKGPLKSNPRRNAVADKEFEDWIGRQW